MNLYQYCRGSPVNYTDPTGTLERENAFDMGGRNATENAKLRDDAATGVAKGAWNSAMEDLSSLGRGTLRSDPGEKGSYLREQEKIRNERVDEITESVEFSGVSPTEELAGAVLTALPGLIVGGAELASLGRMGLSRLVAGADEAASMAYAATADPTTSGSRASKARILKRFAAADHTPSSAETLRLIESGEIKVVVSKNVAPDRFGETGNPGEIILNAYKKIDDLISTIVHEGQHAQDMARNIIPIADLEDVPIETRLFAELRAHTAAGEFAIKNGLVHTEAARGIAGRPLLTIARAIAHKLDEAPLVRPWHIDDAIRQFLEKVGQ